MRIGSKILLLTVLIVIVGVYVLAKTLLFQS